MSLTSALTSFLLAALGVGLLLLVRSLQRTDTILKVVSGSMMVCWIGLAMGLWTDARWTSLAIATSGCLVASFALAVHATLARSKAGPAIDLPMNDKALPRRGPVRVMLLDPDATATRHTARLLDRCGFDLICTRHVAEALQFAHNHPVELMMLDWTGLSDTESSLLADLRRALDAPCGPVPWVGLAHLTGPTDAPTGLELVLDKPLSEAALHQAMLRLKHQVRTPNKFRAEF